MLLILLASVLLSEPAPLEMPPAEGYLVREGGRTRLEDRFNQTDLWVSQAVDGRWVDEEGRLFMLAHLRSLPPSLTDEATQTRVEAARVECAVDRRDLKQVRRAVQALSPVPLAEKPRPPRQLPRGFKDVDYWQGTNKTAIVCAFLREEEAVWRLATWTLAEGDDFDECLDLFEDELFDHAEDSGLAAVLKRFEAYPIRRQTRQPKHEELPSERECLRRDARQSVGAYEDWHVTDAHEFTVLDELPENRGFIRALTNELTVMRARYAASLPTSVDVTNVLCVARIFASRADYLAALDREGLTNMVWTAAYWCPTRRELVAYFPPEGAERLLQTFRHEAFHQYLSYATSLIPVSPWLNEGYAQYFEEGVVAKDAFLARFTPEDWKKFARYLPKLLSLDYAAFYAGTPEERQLNYRLAYTIACFLEEGAANVRFKPFATLKADYLAALLETQDMGKATVQAFKSEANLKLFVSEWLKFWREK